jgi:hypothetical protein
VSDALWIEIEKDGLPDFTIYGFHTGRHVDVRHAGGEALHQIYQGWGIFGSGDGFHLVTHWRQSDRDAPSANEDRP